MININMVFCAIGLLLFQQAAFSIEPSTAVKITPVLKTENSWDGSPVIYPKGQAEITGMLVEIAPGSETGWHLHPAPSFAFVLEGELAVQLKDGQVKKLNAGEAFAEVVNVLHNGRNIGAVPVKLVVFYAGVVGQKISVKENPE